MIDDDEPIVLSGEPTGGVRGAIHVAVAPADRAVLVQPAPATPVPVTSRYLDQGSFARGGSATLHRVSDLQFDRSLAMKIMDPNTRVTAHNKARFVREARITALLEHPGVVPVHELGEGADGRAWFIMKQIRGQTLDVAFRDRPDLRPLVEALLRVCDTIAFAHSRRVLHLDLKPANVMIGAFGEVYVMDWGIAHLPGDTLDGVRGTPSCMAPEQARTEEPDVRTDVYGVGGLLYFGLCGRPPHPGKNLAVRLELARNHPVTPPQSVKPGLPPELCRIAMRALASERADRYPDVLALRAELEAALRGGWWFETRAWPAGSEIVRQGDAADSAWIILEGRVEVWVDGAGVNELGPGETFGELALLCGQPRSATLTALTDVLARVVRADVLDAALQDAWLGPIARGLAARLVDAERR